MTIVITVVVIMATVMFLASALSQTTTNREVLAQRAHRKAVNQVNQVFNEAYSEMESLQVRGDRWSDW